MQKWQSEFFAVASMAAFTIDLRQRGSPESKIVGAPHDAIAEDSRKPLRADPSEFGRPGRR